MMSKKWSMILNLIVHNTGWVEIAHTEEGKLKGSAICCGIRMGYWNTLGWR